MLKAVGRRGHPRSLCRAGPGDSRGHLYGQVTVYDPPLHWATRGRAVPGTGYQLREEAAGVVVPVTKVAVGPTTEGEAAGIARYGDLTSHAATIQKLAAR